MIFRKEANPDFESNDTVHPHQWKTTMDGEKASRKINTRLEAVLHDSIVQEQDPSYPVGRYTSLN